MDTNIGGLLQVFVLTACLSMECVTGVIQKDIRLTGGDYPNTGLLQISKSDGVWGYVCDNDWDMIDRDVACRHLGYSNASSVRIDAGQYGSGRGNIWMEDVQCDGDEDSLWDCQYGSQVRCDHSTDVGLVCQIPGYLGCYVHNATEWLLSTRPTRHFRSTALTIEHCIDFCYEEGFPFAALQNKADCYCETDNAVHDLNRKVEEIECSLPCTGSRDGGCGGIETRSVYNVSASFCPDNLEAPVGGWLKVESRFFGQSATFGCNNGVELNGYEVIPCVLGDSPGEVQWNASAPYCLGATVGSNTPALRPGSDSPKSSIFQENGILFWSVGAVAALLMIALVLITVTMGVQRYNQKRRIRQADDTSVDFDLEPAGPSGTYRHSVHSLHILGQMQENHENNKQEELQRKPSIYLREEVKDSVGMQANELVVFGLQDQSTEDLEWDEESDPHGELESDLEIDPRTSSIEYVGRTAL